MAEKRYAILIGSSEYSEESGLSPLRCPENDVRAVDEILRSPDFGQFTETFVFRNAPSYEILPRLNSVLTEAGKDDLVLIYFSGHGKLNRLGHLCLATANTDSKALEATSIRASTIKSYFDLSYSRKKILLLDCCYSGAAGEEFARTKGGVDEELQLMSGGQGTFIMTASSGIQTSVEKESDQYGLFTKHLVQGIRSGEADKNEDGQVDMQELYEYVHEKVREEGAQDPMKWDLHMKGKLVVSRSGYLDSHMNVIKELLTTFTAVTAYAVVKFLFDQLGKMTDESIDEQRREEINRKKSDVEHLLNQGTRVAIDSIKEKLIELTGHLPDSAKLYSTEAFKIWIDDQVIVEDADLVSIGKLIYVILRKKLEKEPSQYKKHRLLEMAVSVYGDADMLRDSEIIGEPTQHHRRRLHKRIISALEIL